MAAASKPFVTALVLYTLGGAVGLVLASQDDANDIGTVAGGAVVGLLFVLVLWFFEARSHRWPKWLLFVFVIGSIGSFIAFLDWPSIVAIVDGVALAVLLRGWSRIEQDESRRRLGSA